MKRVLSSLFPRGEQPPRPPQRLFAPEPFPEQAQNAPERSGMTDAGRIEIALGLLWTTEPSDRCLTGWRGWEGR